MEFSIPNSFKLTHDDIYSILMIDCCSNRCLRKISNTDIPGDFSLGFEYIFKCRKCMFMSMDGYAKGEKSKLKKLEVVTKLIEGFL